jgi:hypothetical protein
MLTIVDIQEVRLAANDESREGEVGIGILERFNDLEPVLKRIEAVL